MTDKANPIDWTQEDWKVATVAVQKAHVPQSGPTLLWRYENAGEGSVALYRLLDRVNCRIEATSRQLGSTVTVFVPTFEVAKLLDAGRGWDL